VQLVHSLETFCAEHGLDEDAMRAVACGEAVDHQGWECGEVCEYDSPAAVAGRLEPKLASEAENSTRTEEVVPPVSAGASDEDASTATATGDEGTAPPPMNKLLFSMGLPMIANQFLKRADKESPHFLPTLRSIYGVSVIAHLGAQMLMQWRIGASNDTSLVPRASDPMSLLFGGSASAVPQTTAEYDLSQLRSMRSSFQMGVVITLLLHLKFKMVQPLVYQAVSQLVELYFHPLFQVPRVMGGKGCAPSVVWNASGSQ